MSAKSLFRTCFVLFCILGRGPVANATIPQFTDADIEHPASPTQDTKDNFQRSLSGLYAIPSFRAASVNQPFTDIDTLYQHAEPAQHELQQLLTQVSLHTTTLPILPGVKSKERAAYKIATELNGHPELLTDIARGTLVADNIASLVDAYSLLSREATVLETKNRFKTPAASGYRDLKMLVQLPQTGIIAEIQLHLNAIADIKSGPEHDIYANIQQIERTAQAEQRVLNDIERATITQLRNQSQEMYQHAWHQYLNPSLAPVSPAPNEELLALAS
ncbi:phosphoribosylglycinamide formyltransferase [Photobacterium aphoticum]|uniref:Phosphoribosylglycinamide formyltransferase n=1 Tax=Photobacterium aphoticum TaxID=754436 RepID=A0A0J1JIJ0_9GAMM|nr:phosphoribosylglycinamide formyltransferase [Photobacterium aphoticum]KLV01777.1 phosphoribosylglycinamide formyltransferase [Photobacterium aphoticum]PSU58738.1 phosphoribosylglycinamide formyltransferase [Photobacterium aphoticum]GHA32363.1 phosphoribosylglycinamide formyltransferase [Photobacterium aphoticum]